MIVYPFLLIGFENPYTGPHKDLKVLRYTSAGTPSTTGTITPEKGQFVQADNRYGGHGKGED